MIARMASSQAHGFLTKTDRSRTPHFDTHEPHRELRESSTAGGASGNGVGLTLIASPESSLLFKK